MRDAVVLQEVSKRFGSVVAVDRLSMRVPYGCIYGFLGPNGAGKTTTIRMIMGILYPDAGRIEVLGAHNPLQVKERLGYLPEERGLYKKMRVGETVLYFAQLKGLSPARARTRARELLEQFGLLDWYDKPCEALSRGMSQKLQMVITLVHEPELMILDEPFSGLDPVNVEMMRDMIVHLKREGKTVIFSTHVMEQAEQICDYVLLIHRGRKVLDGPLSQVKAGAGQGILLDYDGDGTILRQLPGVKRVNDAGTRAEIFLAEGVDPQEILRRLVGHLRIRRFDLREPSLHEIFIRAVGGTVHAPDVSGRPT